MNAKHQRHASTAPFAAGPRGRTTDSPPVRQERASDDPEDCGNHAALPSLGDECWAILARLGLSLPTTCTADHLVRVLIARVTERVQRDVGGRYEYAARAWENVLLRRELLRYAAGDLWHDDVLAANAAADDVVKQRVAKRIEAETAPCRDHAPRLLQLIDPHCWRIESHPDESETERFLHLARLVALVALQDEANRLTGRGVVAVAKAATGTQL